MTFECNYDVIRQTPQIFKCSWGTDDGSKMGPASVLKAHWNVLFFTIKSLHPYECWECFRQEFSNRVFGLGVQIFSVRSFWKDVLAALCFSSDWNPLKTRCSIFFCKSLLTAWVWFPSAALFVILGLPGLQFPISIFLFVSGVSFPIDFWPLRSLPSITEPFSASLSIKEMCLELTFPLYALAKTLFWEEIIDPRKAISFFCHCTPTLPGAQCIKGLSHPLAPQCCSTPLILFLYQPEMPTMIFSFLINKSCTVTQIGMLTTVCSTKGKNCYNTKWEDPLPLYLLQW